MQVPLIDRLSDFQAGFNSLQNPSFPSQITTTSFNGIQTFSIAFNFCKWGAVILALVATFSSIIKKITIFIIHLRKKASSLPSISFDDGDDFTSDDEDDDNDDIVSLSSSSEFEDESPSVSTSTSFNDFFRISGSNYDVNEVFKNQNDGHKRQRSIGDIFSLLELANSENVVKLWDSIGFGLGLDFDDYEDGVISSYDVVTKPHAPSTSDSFQIRSPLPSLSSLTVRLLNSESSSFLHVPHSPSLNSPCSPSFQRTRRLLRRTRRFLEQNQPFSSTKSILLVDEINPFTPLFTIN